MHKRGNHQARGDEPFGPVKGGVWNRSFSLVRHKYKYLSPDMEQFIETVKAYEDSDILELLPSLIH